MADIDIIAHPDDEKKSVIVTTHDIAGALDAIAEERANYKQVDADMKPIMMIPPGVLEHYLWVKQIPWNEFWGSENQKHMKAFINDPDFALLRLAPGKY